VKALVISGGGAKLWYGAGALAALKKEGREFDCVYGTSAGAICTLLWMQGNPQRAWDLADSLHPNEIVRNPKNVTKLKRIIQSQHLCDNTPMLPTLQKLFPRHTLDFSFKAHAVATNILTQRRKVFELSRKDPDIYRYVVASGAIPTLFPPVKFDKNLVCVDGGAIDNTLLDPAINANCDEITLILLSQKTPYKCNPDNMFDVINSLTDGTLASSAVKDLKLCDARNYVPGFRKIKVNLIRPRTAVPVELFHWTPEQAREAFDMGYTDALDMELAIDPTKITYKHNSQRESAALQLVEGDSAEN
jgi:predicted acylesterase/phospholipase RssA